MPKILFHGRVFPEAFDVSLFVKPTTQFKDKQITDLGLVFSATVSIENNKVAIECDLNKFDKTTHLMPVAMRAYDIARGAVDLISFSSGNALLFVLETMTDIQTRETTALVASQPGFSELSTCVVGPGQFQKVLQVVLSEPHFILTLRDLIDSISTYHRAPIDAARAVDSIRAFFVPEGGKKEDGWEPLRANLRIQRSYLDPVMNISAGPPHGDRRHIPGPQTTDIARRAWIIVNRFFEYLKRGKSGPLPESEFPMLTDTA